MTVQTALARLRELQTELNAASSESWDELDDDTGEVIEPPRRLEEPGRCCARLGVSDLGGVLAVDYYGSGYAGFPEAIAAIGEPGVAEHVAVLRIDGPDEGANGLRDLDFASLIEAAPRFERLRELDIVPSDPGAHNQTVVADDQLPRLIAHMPALRRLTLPQAPEPAFFDLDLPELRSIRTGSDHRTRGFIAALADAARLPALGFVDFGDSLAPFMELEEQPPEWSATSFEEYQRLFGAPVMERMWGLRLRNTRLTEQQYRALQAMRPGCQFSIVLAPPHCYVSHWGRSRFPYRHLLPFG